MYGGMVAIVCMSTCVVSGSCDVQSLWLSIRMVIVCVSSLASILAQWMASKVVMWSMEYARPIPFHVEDFACPR